VDRQTIICIGGAYSGCGKTSVAENLLRLLGGSWCAIKYTRTAFYTSVSQNPAGVEQKDTSRLSRAGAAEVLWVQAPESGLEESIGMAVGMLAHCKGIVVEGNAPIEFLSPDVVIFVFGKDTGRLKPSAQRILNKADIVIYHDDVPDSDPLTHGQTGEGRRGIVRLSTKDRACFRKLRDIVMEKIEKTGTGTPPAGLTEDAAGPGAASSTEAASDLLLRHAKERRIPCRTARSIAEQAGLSYLEVGKLADKLDIKITSCELGCF